MVSGHDESQIDRNLLGLDSGPQLREVASIGYSEYCRRRRSYHSSLAFSQLLDTLTVIDQKSIHGVVAIPRASHYLTLGYHSKMFDEFCTTTSMSRATQSLRNTRRYDTSSLLCSTHLSQPRVRLERYLSGALRWWPRGLKTASQLRRDDDAFPRGGATIIEVELRKATDSVRLLASFGCQNASHACCFCGVGF